MNLSSLPIITDPAQIDQVILATGVEGARRFARANKNIVGAVGPTGPVGPVGQTGPAGPVGPGGPVGAGGGGYGYTFSTQTTEQNVNDGSIRFSSASLTFGTTPTMWITNNDRFGNNTFDALVNAVPGDFVLITFSGAYILAQLTTFPALGAFTDLAFVMEIKAATGARPNGVAISVLIVNVENSGYKVDTQQTGVSGNYIPNLSLSSWYSLSLNGNFAITSLDGKVDSRDAIIRIKSDASIRTLTFPGAWTFITAIPANIQASKTGILALRIFGSNESDVVASWTVQP